MHHISAIAGDAQRNVDFYAGILGLRLVKKTVNFDNPNSYHLYYGDTHGSPGTVMTFFPFGAAARGRKGTGQATVTSYAIPSGSLAFWKERLKDHGVSVMANEPRFDQQVICIRDPDGIEIELITHDGADVKSGWAHGTVPAEHAIRGFYAVTINIKDLDPTHQLLTATMGFRQLEQHGHRYRYAVADGEPGSFIDILVQPDVQLGGQAVGSIHHIAWRVADEAALLSWRAKVIDAGRHATEVKDRKYFKSIYFREPGGVLFELATDGPGFTVDEPAESLGTELKLPDWLESQRSELEHALPPLRLPT